MKLRKTNLLLLVAFSLCTASSVGDFNNNIGNVKSRSSLSNSGMAENTTATDIIMESDREITFGDTKTLRISFLDGQTINDVKGENLDVRHSSMDGNMLCAEVQVKNKFSKLTVSYADKTKSKDIAGNGKSNENDMVETAAYYLYSKEDRIYTSMVSIDSAIIEAGDDPEEVNPSIEVASNAAGFPYVPVEFKGYRGTLQWSDDNGNIFPLEGARISIEYTVNNSIAKELKVVYTDKTGHFNTPGLPLGAGIDSTFKLTLGNGDVEVLGIDSSKQSDSTVGFDKHTKSYSLSLSDYIDTLANGTPLIIKAKTDANVVSDFGAATQIFEGLYYYSKYAKSLTNGGVIEKCSAVFPCCRDYETEGFPKVQGVYYSGNSSMIVIPNIQPDTDNNEQLTVYQSWDVLGHEYGHHVGKFENCCVGVGCYNHYAYRDDIYTLWYSNAFSTIQKAVNIGLSLAWSESWPTYWSEIAQTSFPDAIKQSYAHGFVADRKYEAFNFTTKGYYSIDHGEHFTDISGLHVGGETFETGIIRFLYELNRNVGNHTSTDAPNEDHLWNYVLDCGNTYYANSNYNNMKFSDFYNYLYDLTKENDPNAVVTVEMLSDRAADYLIAPVKIETKKDLNGLYIYWEIGGYYRELESMCKAYLTFYDANGVEFAKSPIEYSCETSGYSKTRARFKGEITSDMLKHSVTRYMSVGLSFSPHYYSWESNYHPSDNGYTGPYTRMIWKGTREQLNLGNLSGIVSDAEW